MTQTTQTTAQKFAGFVKGLGFRAFVARAGTYGFITDQEGSRVLCFGFSDGGTLSGCYGPPSTESGTGWRLETHPMDLRNAEDVRRALHAYPPSFCGKGWKRFTTLEQHLKAYGASSHYTEI